MRFDTHALAWLVHLSKWLLSVITLPVRCHAFDSSFDQMHRVKFLSRTKFASASLPLWATFPPTHPSGILALPLTVWPPFMAYQSPPGPLATSISFRKQIQVLFAALPSVELLLKNEVFFD